MFQCSPVYHQNNPPVHQYYPIDLIPDTRPPRSVSIIVLSIYLYFLHQITFLETGCFLKGTSVLIKKLPSSVEDREITHDQLSYWRMVDKFSHFTIAVGAILDVLPDTATDWKTASSCLVTLSLYHSERIFK